MCSVAVAAEARGVDDCIVVDHSSSLVVAMENVETRPSCNIDVVHKRPDARLKLYSDA